ncbi:MAG: glycosyl transferase family protein [Novosphingobium sp.]
MQTGGLLSAEMLLHGLRIAEHELMLFALFWFVLGAFDELVIDLTWIWLRLTGRAATPRLAQDFAPAPLEGPMAVFFPAWREAEVIGAAISHTLKAWPQAELRIYVGCYPNDSATVGAATAAIGGDRRARLVILDRAGPTTKADCLNRLYAELRSDELRSGLRYRGVILHDAEDMVHPAGLEIIARALGEVDFVQLPVRPEPVRGSPYVAGHYCDEFTEAHAKGLVVRDALGAAIPAAGVGCGFGREILEALAALRRAEGGDGPFAAECLTEDYELGWLIARLGGKSRFLRLRDAAGELVATRAYFPATLEAAVRQKTRWVHGIAFQSWDRLGWSSRPVDIWMAIRDRRGPLTAIVLAMAYVWFAIWTVLAVAKAAGWQSAAPQSLYWSAMLWITTGMLAWRGAVRMAFTAREYGPVEGLRALPRLVVANVIAILASRQAVMAYLRALHGAPVVWDKTTHTLHPAQPAPGEVPG